MSKHTSKTEDKDSSETLLSSSPRWGRPVETVLQSSEDKTPPNLAENGEKKNNFEKIGSPRSEELDIDELRTSSDLHGSSQKFEDDLTPYFFQPILVADPQQRKRATKILIQCLQNSLDSENPQLIKAHIATVVRLATEAPFEDIRSAFETFLQNNNTQLTRKNISVPSPCASPSAFFKTGVVPIDTQNETVATLFQEMFLLTGRVSHVDRILAWHPTYYTKFLQSYNFIMRESGPLPLPLRNYIAILSASRWNCAYLIQQQEVDFLMNGGDPDWIEGIHKIPKKIYNLLELNQLLAHQPWLVTKEHISSLVKSDEAWSIAELVHAIVIMATFRALSGFVWGMGITPEIDYKTDSGGSDGNNSTSNNNNGHETNNETQDLSSNKEIIEKLKQRKNIQPQKLKAEERKHLFEQIEYHAAFPCSLKLNVDEELKVDPAVKKYIGPFTMKHKDFDVKSKTYDVFHVEDYSWREQGYELVKRYYNEAANLLDEQFQHIMELTDYSFNGAPGVDTTPFRTAVWYYVHRIQGVLHDDYDYSLVNSFLGIQLKSLIKKMVCEPYTITKNDVLNIGIQLQPEEKCHIALLATEARKQSELLYALRAVTKWLS